MDRFGAPEPLATQHRLDAFSSGAEPLDRWLFEHARQAEAAHAARTYVVDDRAQDRVVGYHALAAAAVQHDAATSRVRKGQAGRPVPAILLARLAVDVTVQRRGVGALLLRDAMLRAQSASERIGARVLLVHALHPDARAYYERWGFEASPTDPLNLQLLLSDIRRTVG